MINRKIDNGTVDIKNTPGSVGIQNVFANKNTVKQNNLQLPISVDEDWPVGGVRSITSPGVVHKTPGAYLTELIMIYRNPDKVGPFFWNTGELKGTYGHLMVRMNVVLKSNISFKAIHRAIVKHKINTVSNSTKQLFLEEQEKINQKNSKC